MNNIKLFCLPYAGGSAMIYNNWTKYLDNSIILCPIELAGRGKRFQDPFYNNINEAIDDILKCIDQEIIESNYAFFGHSMGSLLIYELTKRIKMLNNRNPLHIFLSGRYPPHIKKNGKILHLLPNDEFKEEILKLGGTPKEVFENKELLNFFLPILKADYKILETYEFNPMYNVLNIDITAFYGKYDEGVKKAEVTEWKRYTNKECKIYEFDGGHFFIHEKNKEIVKIINDTIYGFFKNDSQINCVYSQDKNI